jgi:hypothetical protein
MAIYLSMAMRLVQVLILQRKVESR